MAIKLLPPQSTLLQLLRYEPETGKLYWRPRPVLMFNSEKQSAEHNAAIWNGKNAGQEAFKTRLPHGHRYASINRVKMLAHRVIWKMVHGVEANVIDHIDGDPSNNRIGNLRSVTQMQNGQNERMRKNNTSGVMGVCWDSRRKRWHTRINLNYRHIHVGYFDTFDEAVAARKAAEVQYGFHPNHGRNQEEPLHGEEAERRA